MFFLLLPFPPALPLGVGDETSSESSDSSLFLLPLLNLCFLADGSSAGFSFSLPFALADLLREAVST